MHESDHPSAQIEQIRAIMTRSTTFVSLSGLSGIAAGILAFVAVWQVYRIIGTIWLGDNVFALLRASSTQAYSVTVVFLLTLVAALLAAFFFTWRRARGLRQDLWNMASRRFAIHLALPLVAGGVFALALLQQGAFELICPAMLIFFGIALLNAGKYSFSETIILGTIELVLGLIAAVWVESGLVLWGIGFGLITAGYGIVMFLKYER
jgi:hypothetical protein